MPVSKSEFFTRYVKAIADRDFDALEGMIHRDYVGEYPQSGERFTGFPAFRAQLENYPGGLPAARSDDPNTKILGDDERWAISPGYTVLPLAGPERYTTVTRAPYPDGSRWWVVSILTLKDDRVAHAETYFAPEFEPPEWRKDMVEVVTRD
ncbi:MAG TPA: nuclear transport factor 2 family protein [Candidatus Limnocylindrales bacterium]|nr:nuclear transport factor 2 family protein [Candidatus Limnocylindrales bacterium]